MDCVKARSFVALGAMRATLSTLGDDELGLVVVVVPLEPELPQAEVASSKPSATRGTASFLIKWCLIFAFLPLGHNFESPLCRSIGCRAGEAQTPHRDLWAIVSTSSLVGLSEDCRLAESAGDRQ